MTSPLIQRAAVACFAGALLTSTWASRVYAQCESKQDEMKAVIQKATAEFQSRMQKLSQDAQSDADDLEKEAPKGPETSLGFDIEVGSVKHTIKMNLPEFRLEDMRVRIPVPQVSVKQTEIKFNVPETVMVRKQVGTHPETTCTMERERIAPGVYINVPHCVTRWLPNYMDVPEIHLVEKHITMGLPRVTQLANEIVMGIPRCEIKSQEITFNVPTLKLKNVRVEVKKQEEKANSLAEDYNTRAMTAQAEFKHQIRLQIEPPHTALYDCLRSQVLSSEATTKAQFDAGINSITAAITQMKSQGVNSDSDSLKSLEASRVDLVSQSQAAYKQFDDAIAKLNDSQKQSLEDIRSKL